MLITKDNMAENNDRVENLAINIDMINGFVKEGALAAPSIMRIVPRQQKVLEEYLNDGKSAIMFVRDVHKKDSVEFKTFGEHCVEGTDEVNVIDELKKYYDYAYHVTKNSTNFVFGDTFQEQIENLKNLKQVLLMGCLSDVCVLNGGVTLRNYFDQLNRDIDVCVDSKAIDTYDAPMHNADEVTRMALDSMRANGIKIL